MIGSSVAMTRACLERITSRNSELGAFIMVDPDGAMQTAMQSDARRALGKPLSPLDGMPIGIKANIAVRGLPFHAGIGAYRDRVAMDDASCVARLRDGGAIILGLLNMDEGALGAVTDNPVFGRTQNPWRRGYTAGGSSGGAAAAVAAGFCVAALGTDTLGSVRIPAAYCGVFAHRPGTGLVSSQGIVPLAAAYDQVGVLARAHDVLTVVMAWLAPSELRPTEVDGGIGILDVQDKVRVEAGVSDALDRTAAKARDAGLDVQRIELPNYDFTAVRKAALLVMEREAGRHHEAALSTNPQGFSEALRRLLSWGAAQSDHKAAAAIATLQDAAAQVRAAFLPFRAVLLPTVPAPPFLFGALTPNDQADYAALASITGLACTSFPAGLGEDGLPRGISVMGAEDATCLGLAGITSFGFLHPPKP